MKKSEKYPGWVNVNDTYKIYKDLHDLKLLIEELEKDIKIFLGPKKSKSRSTSARRKLRYLRKELIPILSKKIIKTKQDYESDYS